MPPRMDNHTRKRERERERERERALQRIVSLTGSVTELVLNAPWTRGLTHETRRTGKDLDK